MEEAEEMVWEWLRLKVKKCAKQLKRILKKILIINQLGDGHFAVYIRFPFRFNSKFLFALRHATKPIKPHKIVFDNYMGKGYGCNPKYVAEKLLEKYPGKFDVIWIVSKADITHSEIPGWIRKVDYASQEALREYATAKVWVSNYHKISFLKRGLFKRKGQYFIQMWHGSLGIKKIENDVSCLTVDRKWLKQAKRSSKMVDFWVSDSSFENDVYHRAFWGVKNILMYGHPRNDILFWNDESAREKVKAHFKIEDKKILLYAPTFREDYRLDCYRIDFEALQGVLHDKFGGEWAILVRLHPRVRKYIKKILPAYHPGIYDATYYTDIQELIAGADCMITDYSSCIFDFMLTRRPGFLFTTDIEDYNTERGFYYPLEDTPFPIGRSNEELFQNIVRFDMTSYQDSIERFLKSKGCIEDGHASERVADKIAELVGIVMDEEIKINQEKTAKEILHVLYDRYHRYPIERNKIVCVNFHGKGYGCNPKYIVEELLRHRSDLDIVWLVKGAPEKFVFPVGIRVVPYHSEQAIREIATARILIDNTMKFSGFKKRPNQYFIQTWHCALPLKRVGYDNPINQSSKKYRARVEENFLHTDLVLSNSKFSSELFRRAFGYDGEILEKGCPRNDILVNTPPNLKKKICALYQIPTDKKLVLLSFADKKLKDLLTEYHLLLEQMGEDYVVLAHLHPQLQSHISYTEQIINVSDHLDIRELMAVSDLMITDDSESILEFVLAGRLAYLFTARVADFFDNWNSYFDSLELPYPTFSSMEELVSQLNTTNLNMYYVRVENFKQKVGLCETGQAAQAVVELIENLLQEGLTEIETDYKMSIENNAIKGTSYVEKDATIPISF